MRYASEHRSLVDGIAADRYVGVYARCSGLNSGRFAGKRQSEEVWRELFSYYIELWLSQLALAVVSEIVADAKIDQAAEAKLAEEICGLFDKTPARILQVVEIEAHVRNLQRELDYLVNNATFTGKLPVDVQATRGRLIFGIPSALVRAIPALESISFVYQLDEFENLTADQQRHINTLVREREAPATFKIGGRQFGVKTHGTFSDGEVNLKDSEYEELRLDEQFRSNANTYKELARRLAARRLSQTAGAGGPDEPDDLASLATWFDQPDVDWRGSFFLELCGETHAQDRVHFAKLNRQLQGTIADSVATGASAKQTIQDICALLEVAEYPLLEKVNILYLYQSWAREKPLLESAKTIAEECRAFLSTPEAPSSYRTKLQHFKADLTAQLIQGEPFQTVLCRRRQLRAHVRRIATRFHNPAQADLRLVPPAAGTALREWQDFT